MSEIEYENILEDQSIPENDIYSLSSASIRTDPQSFDFNGEIRYYTDSDVEYDVDSDEGYEVDSDEGYTPLHPFLRRGRIFINEDNYKTFEQTPESCLESVRIWGPSLSLMKDEFRTYEVCKAAVENNSYAIYGVYRSNLITKDQYKELCLLAVTNNGFSIKEISFGNQDQEICDAAIKSSCCAIMYMDSRFKTYDLCLKAVSLNGTMLEFVPDHLIDVSMCDAAMSNKYGGLDYVPNKFKTYDVCLKAVTMNGRSVTGIRNKEYFTPELGLAAVQSDSCCIQWIPKEYHTQEMIKASLYKNGYMIASIEQTPENCLYAIKRTPRALSNIKRENITLEICKIIMKLDDQHLDMFVPQDMLEFIKNKIESEDS
jgi:hypothetical protein